MVSLVLVLGFCLGLLAAKECGERSSHVYSKDIPSDCEVWKGNVTYNLHWPEKLSVIEGRLTLKAFFDRSIKVQDLYLDARENNLSGTISFKASLVHIQNMNVESILLKERPKEIIIIDCPKFNLEVKEAGYINRIKLESSNVTFTGFQDIAVGNFLLDNSYARSTGPLFKEVNSVVLKSIPNQALNILKVKSSLQISGSIEISLPYLKAVGSDILVSADTNISLFSAPSLQSGRINIQGHVKKINVPLNLTWHGEATFNAENFCPKFHFAFTSQRLLFKAKKECNQNCIDIGHLLLSTIQEIQGCERVLGNLVVDHNSPPMIDLGSLEYVYGDLEVKNYNGSLSLPSLTEIEGALTIADSSGLPDDALFKLESALRMNLTNISSDLNFNALQYILGDLEVKNSTGELDLSSLKEIKGVLTFVESSGFSDKILFKLESTSGVNLINLESDLNFNALHYVRGDLEVNNCTGKLGLSLLKEVNGALAFANYKGTFDTFFKLQNAFMVNLVNVSSDLNFSALTIEDGLNISDSSLTSFTGLISTHLNTLKISGAPKLSIFSFQSLESVGNLYIHNTALDLSSAKFHKTLSIHRDMTIKGYRFKELRLTTAHINGTFSLVDNKILEHVYFSEIEHLNNPIFQANNPILQIVMFQSMAIEYHVYSNELPEVLVASREPEKHPTISSTPSQLTIPPQSTLLISLSTND
ncbi:protoplasts-secreted, variant 2 [Entomophthora muscae]|uniref:Protoplasts-secreted, variant 2 n=1 Tax=Entomophthora muscae TaxID=34485 RepID=A0ACC2TTH2_9FUNG|nr:protoplasts-secreted, variant 2 [Entomophthora muscae]